VAGAAAGAEDEQATAAIAHRGQSLGHRIDAAGVEVRGDRGDLPEILGGEGHRSGTYIRRSGPTADAGSGQTHEGPPTRRPLPCPGVVPPAVIQSGEVTLNELGGRRIVVIGGTGGIGGATVHALLQRGGAVLAVGRDRERLEGLRRAGAAVVALSLGDPRTAGQLADAAERELGGVDALVAAAGGYGPIGSTRSVDLGAVRASLDENLFAILGCMQALAPALDRAPDPSVVLLSGGGATAPLPRYAAYSIAKVATVRLAESIALEEPGWRVNTVAPGFVATGIHDATREAGPEDAGRMYAETERQIATAVAPEHAAELIAFLVGPGAAGITGRLISAVWDPWREEAGRRRLREDPSFGRLRRVDAVRIVETAH
jgi:3-oxoacyl-[acyl-carrier protein] reductase